jgi:predicted nuclease of predicted toxin-antitoxin system
MKLLLDQALPRSTARLLRETGIDCVHVGEIGDSTAEDTAILERAKAEDCVIVTMDADFHAILALSGVASPSVVRIRTQGLRGEDSAPLIQTVITYCGEELSGGAVVSVQKGRIRIRRLPLLV